MKRFLDPTVIAGYLQSLGHISARVARCLEFGLTEPSLIGGIWTNAIDSVSLGRFLLSDLVCGSIVSDPNQPELNRHKRSREPRHLAVLPT